MLLQSAPANGPTTASSGVPVHGGSADGFVAGAAGRPAAPALAATPVVAPAATRIAATAVPAETAVRAATARVGLDLR